MYEVLSLVVNGNRWRLVSIEQEIQKELLKEIPCRPVFEHSSNRLFLGSSRDPNEVLIKNDGIIYNLSCFS